tara:strand:+ start:518 stop:1657 length:1140 start_codon:yes stop_codon:yes gene_type:complete
MSVTNQSTLPQIRFCKLCLTPDSRPRIEFDSLGVCNACLNAEEKNQIDWDIRREQFLRLVEESRPSKGPYDCIVPWSGGKDSSAIAYKLKFEFGLNPLLVTFSPLIPNDVGVHNREALIRAGFDHLMIRPNQNVSRHLARRFFIERANPKIGWDAGINSVPLQAAVNYKIPLVVYAEHGESEYGGRVLSEEHRKIRDMTEILEHLVGDYPGNWVDDVVKDEDLAPYMFPSKTEIEDVGVKAIYFSYFFRWSMYENYQYIRDRIEFHTNPAGRTDGTFNDFDSLDDKIDNLYYYTQFIKFGFGRTIRDASRMIQNGQMTREEGLELARKYDGEFPSNYHADHLDYLDLSETEFTEVIDLHRNPEVWLQDGNQWKLRFSPE